MKILKFGGSSIGTPERITSVANIIKQSKKEHGEIAVVASAMEGITNQLIDVSKQAFRGDQSYENALKELENRHIAIADMLLGFNSDSHSHRFIVQSFH